LNAWEIIVQQPVINVLIVLTNYLSGSFGMAIIVLTVVVNLVMLPLTMKQIKASRAMQEIQPKIAELQKKYANDKQKLGQEQMRLYKESGMSPAGCMLPMFAQMPIWIALYQSIMLSLAVAPEGLVNLSRYLYQWPGIFTRLPLESSFLWFDLAQPDTPLALLVGATMWLQQKMATPVSSDPKQGAQARMMLWMMPIMFSFLAISFPSGLPLFWTMSSIVRIVLQYRVTGWGGLTRQTPPVKPVEGKKRVSFSGGGPQTSTEDTGADIVIADDEKGRREQGLGILPSPSKARYQPGKERQQHRKKK